MKEIRDSNYPFVLLVSQSKVIIADKIVTTINLIKENAISTKFIFAFENEKF